jgi:putative ABC transport system permease protein
MRNVTLKGVLARKLRLALTALAVVLGVTFVSGTLVLGDTLNRTFDNLIGNVYQHVSFEIRGKAVFGSGTGGVDDTTNRRPVPQAVAAAVRKIPGVAFDYGSVEGYAQFVKDGDSIGNGGSQALGFSFDPNPKLSALRLVAGRAPVNGSEVVMDEHTARANHFQIGQRVEILLPGHPQTFTITGIVTFGSASTLVGTTLAGFYLPTAQRLFDLQGHYDAINVLADQGADNVKLQQAIARTLPAGVQVVSGQTVASQVTNTINSDLSFLSTALLVFAFISLFVGGFTIFNTFSITVGQRTRELALLRVVGASRQQLFRSVLAEAAVVGLFASLVGLGLGVLAAVGLKALLGSFGLTLPPAPLIFEARTAIVAIVVGVGVTMISAIGPARRALAIPPVAALTEHSEDAPESLRGRAMAGGGVALVGLVALLGGLSGASIGLVGFGTLTIFIAAGLLAPLVARPVAGTLGRLPARALGTAGQLGRENAMRNPRRTAQTAAALMVGLALVSTIAVLGASLSQSATSNVDSAVRANYIIGGSGVVSKTVSPAIQRLPGVVAVATVYKGQFEFEGSLEGLVATSAANTSATVRLSMTAGRAGAALAAGEMLVDTTTASSDNLHVGSLVPVTFAQTGATHLRIGGIFKPNDLVGSYVVGDQVFLANFDNPVPNAMLVRTSDGATPGFTRLLNRTLAAYANLSIQTREQFEQQQQRNVNKLLGLVYVLLALAVVIALIGIVNTLMLSVFERTREIGLLRAVGMEREQVRSMVRAEAVIIALFGAVIGIVIGTGLGVALTDSLRKTGVGDIVVPYGRLVVFFVIAGLLGLGAAGWPARRAAKLDVLEAIATQ